MYAMVVISHKHFAAETPQEGKLMLERRRGITLRTITLAEGVDNPRIQHAWGLTDGGQVSTPDEVSLAYHSLWRCQLVAYR
jgi:hypothetical protein